MEQATRRYTAGQEIMGIVYDALLRVIHQPQPFPDRHIAPLMRQNKLDVPEVPIQFSFVCLNARFQQCLFLTCIVRRFIEVAFATPLNGPRTDPYQSVVSDECTDESMKGTRFCLT